jgi:signal transduction histidine kinase
MCSVVLALVWARLIYNRNTRQNASVELSRAILLMQANAGILDESVEKNEMLIDEINSITKKLTRKDEADEFIKARDELASILESLAVIKALNLQAAGLSTSQSITKSINDVLKENKQLIARKKIKTNKKIQPGLKIGLPAALSYRLIETNLRNAFKLTDKGSAIDVSLKSVGQKAILKIEYKGLALSRRMLHLLEGPIENYRALDATGTALFVNKIIAESIGGQFDVVSDSKYGTTVRIKFSKSNAKIDKFKPVNKELDNPELAPFNGKAKPA